MKKLGVLMTALVLCVAIGLTGVASAKTIKVKSKITLSFAQGSLPYSPYTQDRFFGDVKAKKGCKKKRKVVINGTTLKTKTNGQGSYSINAANVGAGTYTATVKKKIRKKPNGNRIVCKKATSKPVVVP